jgi:hypothetical protein
VSPGVISQMNPGPYWPLYLWGPHVGGLQTNRPLPRGSSSRPMVAGCTLITERAAMHLGLSSNPKLSFVYFMISDTLNKPSLSVSISLKYS